MPTHALVNPFTSAFQALVFRRVPRGGVPPRWPLLVVVLIALLTDIAVGFAFGEGEIFMPQNIPGWGFVGMLLFVIGQWGDRRPDSDCGWLLCGLYFAAGALLSLLYYGAWLAVQEWASAKWAHRFGVAVWFAVPVWFGLALGAAAGRGIGWPRWRIVALALLVVCLLFAERALFPYANHLWRPDFSTLQDPPPPPPKLAYEESIYGEPGVLNDALDAILPGKRGKPEVFSITLAGDAEQEVFLREARSFDALFHQRFGTSGHSIVLANHDSVTGEIPIASRTSLNAALLRMGQQMNREEDVLVLYLTSHGGKNHDFLLDDAPLELDPITPQWLKQALQDAGIRWQIIIVSACYSGGYVAPLAGPNVLIATAADAKHTSFGCADENDFTYYGEALYHALQREKNWVAAIEMAQRNVSAREKREHIEPSHPQLSVGAAIERKLLDWQAK
ncbi:C13 family peptidase [Andreprevotia chitinilytica]|uniref:C13 family peptidase n=1 Tax=Andreprevotia chitinilytica TaxID=396808 RepID=UPI00068BFA39|nr:C13 family peptidase [Andreprevotia chitinilytica]